MRKANSSPVPVQHSRNDTVGRELSGLRDPEVSLLRGSQTNAIKTLRPQDYESTRPSKLEQRHQHPSRTSRLLCIMLRAAIGMVLFALSSGCNTTTTFACSSENTEYIILYVRTLCSHTLSGKLGNTCLLHGVFALAACSVASQGPLSFEAGKERYPISPSVNSPIVIASLSRGRLKKHPSYFSLHDLVLPASWIRGRLKMYRICSGLFYLLLPRSLIWAGWKSTACVWACCITGVFASCTVEKALCIFGWWKFSLLVWRSTRHFDLRPTGLNKNYCNIQPSSYSVEGKNSIFGLILSFVYSSP